MALYRVKVTEKHSDTVWVEADSAEEAKNLAPQEADCQFESLYDCEVLEKVRGKGRCKTCRDILTGHEDDSTDECRWCNSGWKPSATGNSFTADNFETENI